ncbi:MAG: Hsp20/alpha crystallin family protein [Candidatus Omnitrophota bacterium]
MRVVRWRPFSSLNSLRNMEDIQEEMNRLFDFSLDKSSLERELSAPAVDISEDDKNIYVEADLPGFEQKDIKLSVKDDVLRLWAAREEKKEEKKGKYHRSERYQGSFERIIPFAKKIETDKIKAQYKNGVLKIGLPKAQDEQSKEIEVKVE